VSRRRSVPSPLTPAGLGPSSTRRAADADLESETFAVHGAAVAGLEKLGELAVPVLENAAALA
jgi:hypothetical protein